MRCHGQSVRLLHLSCSFKEGHSPLYLVSYSDITDMATAPSALPASTPLTAEVAENLGILPASHWHHDEDDAGADTDDTASTIGSITSSTASLSESIFEYRQILGRPYHRDVGTAEAWQPNDPRHIEAMDLFHHLQTLILSGKLFRAPLSKSIQKSSISEPAPVFGQSTLLTNLLVPKSSVQMSRPFSLLGFLRTSNSKSTISTRSRPGPNTLLTTSTRAA